MPQLRQPQTVNPAAPPSGSQTITHTPAESEGEAPDPNHEIGVLRLRGGPVRRQRVVWADEVVDNEGMGKKSSKSKSGIIAE